MRKSKYFSLLLCILVASMPQLMTCAESYGNLRIYHPRISYAVREGVKLLDAVGSTAAFVHQNNIIVCHTMSREDTIVNVFDFADIRNIGEMVGAFSHKGRFLTMSKRGRLENNQNFYIFQNVGMYRELLQATDEALLQFTGLPAVLNKIIIEYIANAEVQSLQSQQYFLYDIIVVQWQKIYGTVLNQETIRLGDTVYSSFQFRDSGEIVCYAQNLCDPTVVFNLGAKKAEFRAIGNKIEEGEILSRNGRFVLYRSGVNRVLLDRLKGTHTACKNDPMSYTAFSIDYSGNLVVYLKRTGDDIELAIREVRAKQREDKIRLKVPPCELKWVYPLGKDSYLLGMLQGMCIVSKRQNVSRASSFLWASKQTYGGITQDMQIIGDQLREAQQSNSSCDIWNLQHDGLPKVLQRVVMDAASERLSAHVYPVTQLTAVNDLEFLSHASPDGSMAARIREATTGASDKFQRPQGASSTSSSDVTLLWPIGAVPRLNSGTVPILVWYRRPDWWLKCMVISTATLAITYGALRWWNIDKMRMVKQCQA